MKTHNYKKLQVWQESVDLAVDLYKVLQHFPTDEKFGITSQIKRSIVSVPSNIAEGAGRHTPKQFVQFLSNANGSACEADTQLIIANRVGFLEDEVYAEIENRLNKIQRMLYNLADKMN